jgi:hypothetical protein
MSPARPDQKLSSIRSPHHPDKSPMHLVTSAATLAQNLLSNPALSGLFNNLPHLPANSPLHAAAVPEPATWGLMAGAVVGSVAVMLRRRRGPKA